MYNNEGRSTDKSSCLCSKSPITLSDNTPTLHFPELATTRSNCLSLFKAPTAIKYGALSVAAGNVMCA
jgi:hypothetical protein